MRPYTARRRFYAFIMNQKSTVMLAVFVALGVTLVAGLIAIPAMEQSAQAS
jgi:fumarate reductase subunit C